MDEATELFNKFMEQQMFSRNQAPSQKKVDSDSVQQQRILSELQSRPAPASTSIAPAQGQCPQCNLFHPPLPPGQKCPNAPVKIEGIDTNKVSDFLIKIKDILTSQLEQKGVKNFDKFGGGMVVALMKYCEEYKEDEKI